MSDRPAPTVLVLCKDLMFSSQLNGGVQRAGLVPQTCLGIKTVEESLQKFEIDWLIVDLELEGLDLAKFRESTSCKLIGFGPHVHVERLAAAQAAGFDYVLSRGQISSGLDQLLSSS
ncbi:hypothetical protein N8553_03215 [bacterium]|jgi:hypothetical protein|nr:hypothetical protein [Planctomicrobium sp.]MDA7503972.1 hypothetical protein [bacterium]